MVLPPGVNKASGLKAALSMLDISVHNVVAVGDAENDHAFLGLSGCAAAVANALPTIRDEADIKLSGDHGAGVAELIEKVICEDVRIIPPSRQGLLVGTDRTGQRIYLEPDCHVLIAGKSQSGKSRFATMLTERMAEKQFEFCVIDPEGDYEGLQHAICIGHASKSPTRKEALTLVCEIGVNLVINTVALNRPDRQRLFDSLIGPVAELRARTGRPHWLLIDRGSPDAASSDSTGLAPLAERPSGHNLRYCQSSIPGRRPAEDGRCDSGPWPGGVQGRGANCKCTWQFADGTIRHPDHRR